MKWLSFLVAFGVTMVTTPAVARLARATGIVDRPGALKVHREAIPLLGGLAVGAGWLVGALAAGLPLRAVVLGVAAVGFAVGAIDDVHPLPPLVRVAALTAAGTLLWIGGVDVALLGPLAGMGAAMLFVGAANGVNLVDGLDGLAGGCIAISGLALAIVGGSGAAPLALSGAAAGFLVWNRHPARIFLGDGGAYALGGLLAASVSFAAGEGARSSVAAALCLGVFVVEPVATIARRAKRRVAMTQGDRDHIYDRLVGRGLSVPRAVAFMWLGHAALAGAGVALARAGAGHAVVILATGGVFIGAASLAWRARPEDVVSAPRVPTIAQRTEASSFEIERS